MTRIRLAGVVLLLVVGFLRASAAQSGGSWIVKTPMPTPRTEVAAAALGEKIYVIGGFGKGRRSRRGVRR
jgi:hypothetical protein